MVSFLVNCEIPCPIDKNPHTSSYAIFANETVCFTDGKTINWPLLHQLHDGGENLISNSACWYRWKCLFLVVEVDNTAELYAYLCKDTA